MKAWTEAELARALADLQGTDEPPATDPAVLWRKAQLFRALDSRRRVVRPLRAAHAIALVLAAGALVALAGSPAVSLASWVETASKGLVLPLLLALLLLGGALVTTAAAAVGLNLSRRD